MKKIIASIKKLTGYNLHTEAVIKLAEFLKNETAIVELNKINSEHEKLHYITNELRRHRFDILQSLLSQVKKEYGHDIYHSFHKVF